MNKLSQIFRPFNLPHRKVFKLKKDPNETSSKGYKLLCNYGLIRQSSPGMYYVLPMGQRVIEKLVKLLDRQMARIGAQKIFVPLLSKQTLWKKADTYEKSSEELFELEDRKGVKFVLNPTHEQSLSHLLSTELMSYRDFPKLLYQIAPKFRDEHRPKLGLLRSKEFLMKDLYSFDINPTEAENTYNKVTAAYNEIFNMMGIKFLKATSVDESGIRKAHEYFYISEVGDDKLYNCRSCNSSFHLSALLEQSMCPECSLYLEKENYVNGIEVAHTFSFGTYFSDRLNSCYVNINCKRTPLHMCSFGIGVSRLVSACAEVLSTENDELRWPLFIAPFTVCIITPKAGSLEEIPIKLILPDFCEMLEAVPTLTGDILIDDREEYTIGKRLLEAKLMGYPFIIVVGKAALDSESLYEIHDINNDKKYVMPKSSLMQFLIRETEILSGSKRKTVYIGDRHPS